jgi:hypothetical protein
VNQAASLQNLNDIVAPPPVGWWPPAPGWYLLAVLLLAVLLYLGVRWWLTWRRNRYRRAALDELHSMGVQRLPELPALLKRAALAIWPREQVAALSGAEWHRFLDETAGKTLFTGDAGQALDRLAYAGRSRADLSEAEIKSVVGAAEYWLRNHRVRKGEAD